jgi:transposase InsO family protein
MESSVTQIRIMQNGSGWYWEVVTQDRAVIARGTAETHARARADAEKAALQPAEQYLAA